MRGAVTDPTFRVLRSSVPTKSYPFITHPTFTAHPYTFLVPTPRTHAMDPSSIISAVCIMGRTSTPLYFRVFTDANPLDMELIVYSSLDTLDEKVGERGLSAGGGGGGAPPPPTPPPASQFLGLLLHVEEYKVFGYATSTSTRIIVVVKDVLLSVASVKDMFSRLHKAYADAAASPFTVSMDAPMSSPSFHAAIASVVKEAGAALLFSA